jgi:hypothetical protein
LPVEARTASDGEPELPRWREPDLPPWREPDLAGVATFTLDLNGAVTWWSAAATAAFGRPAHEVVRRHVCDVLMTGLDQRKLITEALAEVAAGGVWIGALTGGQLGAGRFAVRCEPLAGGVLVIAERARTQPGPGWLSAAAARIGNTLDLTKTAAEVVDVAVPGFADAAVIYVAERLLVADEAATPPRPGHGLVVRRLAARLGGQDTTVTDSVFRPGEAVVFGADTPYLRAMTTGGPVLFDHLDSETAERIARRPGGRAITSAYTSFLAVPLVAGQVVVGCAAFGRVAAGPPFSAGDIVQAVELASRAAVCIDNARLYHRERRTVLALQRGLLPGRPDVPAGLEMAHRYLPVGASVVGGDWHDIVPLAGGRAALIVGDAMGHGPEAAAVMVQLRTAAHTLAGLDLAPGHVLRRLDAMAAGMAAASFATCVYTIIDPKGSSCVVAQAGHLPPVLVLAGGATEILDLPPGLPLGLGAENFEATQIQLPPGATLALYTDGLVESRTRPLDDGVSALRDALSSALAAPGGTLAEACRTVTQALRQHGEDDLTLVLARIRQ